MIHTLDNITIADLAQSIRLGEDASFLYRKQVAYVGKFGQHDHATGKLLGDAVNITKAEIDHWALSVKEQVADGVDIPMQKTHNPASPVDETYGHVIDAETGLDEKGRYSLFFICSFGDEEKAKVAPVSGCSIYQPASYANGVGKRYVRPIRHLMLTTSSTIPDMGKFIALSLIPDKGIPTMNEFLKNLAITLGITVAEDATDESLSGLISAAYMALNKKVSELTAKVTEVTGLLDAAKTQTAALSLPPVVVTTTQNLRKGKLDALVGSGKISPAMRDSLVESFKKPSGIVALSLSEDQTSVNDEVFDSVLVALSLIPDAAITGRKMQNVGDENDGDDKDAFLSYVKKNHAKKE